MLQGLQRAVGPSALLLLLCGTMPNQALALGVASSPRFIVYAPTQRLADKAVGDADAFADQVAADWQFAGLPGSAPPDENRTTIFIEVDAAISLARTRISPRGDHLMWLTGSERAVTDHLLHHEVAHTVMASRFGGRMPIWANEGIASGYDNPRRHAIRRQKLVGFAAIDSWPQLDELFEKPIRQQWQYAAAVSLTEFLVDRGGRKRFVAFVERAEKVGHADALLDFYKIESVDHLQAQWQRYVENQPTTLATASVAASSRSFR